MNISTLSQTLPIMVKGMLGIFIVTGVIILTMMILNKASENKSEKK